MLTEYTTPGESIEIRDDQTIYSLLTDRLARTGADTVIAAKKIGPGRWQNVTAGEFHERVVSAAKGLIALGITKGDAVTIFSSTRLEWGILDFALAAVGAVSVPIYDTDSAPQAQRIMNDSAVKLAFADNRERYDRLDSVKDHCPTLKQILMIDGNALGALEGLGVAVSDEELDEHVATVRTNDLATIVYTSGSTGNPKGAELTHKNFVSITIAASQALHEVVLDDHPRLLLFLPLAHCFARFIQYASIASDDGVVGYLPDTKSLLPDLRSFEPTYLLGVPRVFEKVYNAASQKAGHGPKGVVFASAVVAAQNYMKEISANGKASALTRARRAAFDPIVYSSLREVLGGRMKWIVAGGAPLDPELLAFFRGASVPVYEGYGLTETTAPCAFNPLGTPFHAGSVGVAFPGFSLRIAEDGEIQVKGRAVFPRYHKNDEATELSFTEDGWYATGDLGRIDNDGFLYITGRKKDLIITAGGKNVAPGPIEEAIQRCEFVSQALVLGDKRPFISALITLDEESLRPWLAAKGLDENMSLEDASQNAAVRAEVQKWIDQANEGVSRAESVRKFIILPEEFTQENGLMTASMKVIRPKVIKRYSTLLNTQMYTKKK